MDEVKGAPLMPFRNDEWRKPDGYTKLERIGTIKSYVEGAGWVGLPAYLQALADKHHLEYEERRREKAWFGIRVTVFYKVVGRESDLYAFADELQATAKEWNKV